MDDRKKSKSTHESKGVHYRKGIKANMEIPINLERVLIEAAKDSAFFEKVMMNREQAVSERGFDLRPSELAMLSTMPESLFEKLIERFRPAKLHRSRFAQRVVSAVTGSMMLAATGCAKSEDKFDSADAGIDPDYEFAEDAADRFVGMDTGIDPEFPEDAGKDDKFVYSDTGTDDGRIAAEDATSDADDDGGSENP